MNSEVVGVESVLDGDGVVTPKLSCGEVGKSDVELDGAKFDEDSTFCVGNPGVRSLDFEAVLDGKESKFVSDEPIPVEVGPKEGASSDCSAVGA